MSKARDIRRQAHKAQERVRLQEARTWAGLDGSLAQVRLRTNWESQVEQVCYLGSSAARLTDETPAELAARKAVAIANGKNGNRLRQRKATGVTTWERNRNRQHSRAALSECKLERPKMSLGTSSKSTTIKVGAKNAPQRLTITTKERLAETRKSETFNYTMAQGVSY